MERVKLNSRGTRLLAVLLVLAGCYWSRYPELMETHLVLLDEFSGKLVYLAKNDGGVPMADWNEFVYPLERAQDFARIAAQRFPDRTSLAEFRVALERYAVLVDDPTMFGRAGVVEELEGRRSALEKAIAATRIELQREADS
ncbi:MAG: hypothetical protein P8R42_22755 [Candidatus Binatia bacterium]|nr:hypothetical protein [Candidatus Binatia bacterium]